MVDPSELEPERVARREFTTTFRGFDQVEVRAFLSSVSLRLREVLDRERDLLTRIDESQPHPVDLDQIDEHRLTELLGEETARIFEAAREAATEIRAKAEAKTAQLVREAQADANRMTSEAAEVMRLRTAEAETAAASIRSDAESDRDRILADARAEADALRVQVDAEVEQLRTDAQRVLDQAETDAASALEEARQQGREMVSEAQVVRERILKDLARRRRTGKAQLEQLRAARERLLDAYALVRRTLEEATTELSVAVPEAKLAAESAGRRVESDDSELSVEAIEAELDAGRVAGVPLLDTGEVPVARPSPPSEPELPSEPEPATQVESAAEAEAQPAPAIEAEREPLSDAEPPPEPPPAPVLSGADGDGHEDDDGSAAAGEEPGRLLALVPELDDAAPVTEPEGPAEADVVTEADVAAKATGDEDPRVDELFARLRSEVPDIDVEPTGDHTVASEASAEAGEGAEDAVPVDDSQSTDGDEADEPDDPDEVALERRDRYVLDLEREMARILKRQLADDENDKLDLIRRRPAKAVATEVLPALDQHRATFVEATTDTLLLAAASGSELATTLVADDDPAAETVIDLDVEVDDLAVEMVDALLVPIRERVKDLAGGTDPDDALDGVRACYRRWKATIGDLAAQYVHTAFNRGIYAALPDGTLVRWVVDPGAGPCPDGEDDALEGPIAKGAPFPTGHLHPPAHPGCRCLLVPGDL